MQRIKKIKIRPSVLVFALLSIVGVSSFALLLTKVGLAQFTPPCDTPPNCQPASGAVTATLMDVLVNGPLAAKEFGKVKDPEGKGFIGIGGGTVLDAGQNVDAGEVRLGIGTSTPGFPLDVISQTSGNPDKDTANLRLGYRPPSSMSGQDLNVWTGVRLDRGNSNGTQSEKWFLGMASSSDNFIIRSDSNTNLVEIPRGKGAACFGGVFRQLTPSAYTGLVTDGALTGYAAANKKCPADMHICSIEEMFRTIQCSPTNITSIASEDAGWITASPVTAGATSDCGGWTDDSSGAKGTWWYFDGAGSIGQSWSMNCDAAQKFACCK